MQFSCFEFWVRGKKIENALIMSKNLKNDIDQVIVSTNVPLTKIPRMPLTSDNFGLLGHIQDQHYINKKFQECAFFFFFGILECLWQVTTLACWGAFIFNLLGYIRERLIQIIFHASVSKSVFCFVFFYQCFLYCSWNMNSTLRQMYNIWESEQ